MNHDRLIHFVKRTKKKESERGKEKCNSFFCCCWCLMSKRAPRKQYLPEAQDTQGNQKVDKFLWNHGGKSSKLLFFSVDLTRTNIKNAHMWIETVFMLLLLLLLCSFETRRLKGSYYIVSWFFYFGHDASRLKCLSNRIHTSTHTHTRPTKNLTHIWNIMSSILNWSERNESKKKTTRWWMKEDDEKQQRQQQQQKKTVEMG